MKDIKIAIENRPGALAEMGEALEKAGVSIEGGGAWLADKEGVAHFLFKDGNQAIKALEQQDIKVLAVNDVVMLKLNQEEPGQLGKFTRLLERVGVNIEVLYSDHYNQLIVVVDDFIKGRIVSNYWSMSFNR